MGKSKYIKQDYYSAIDLYKEALKLNPRDLKANKGLSDAFFMIGEYDEALIYINNCMELSGGSIEILNSKGRVLTALERYDEAKELYERVLSMEMYNIGAKSGIAELRVVSGDIKGSLYDFEKVLKFSPKSRRLLLSVAVLYNKEMEFEKAEALIQKALRNYPGDPIVLEAAVIHYMSSKNYIGASIYMDELRRISDNRELYLLEAELKIYLEEYSEAVKILSEYIKEDKKNAKSYYLAAVALDRSDDKKRALNLLKRALMIRPDEEIYRFFKESIINDLFTLKDDNRGEYSAWYLNKGMALEERFYYQKAKTYYLRGLDINPLSSDLRYAYANILKRMEYKKRYLKELEVILEHNKGYMDVGDTYMIEKSLPLEPIYEKWGDVDFKKDTMFTLSVFIDSRSKEYNLFSSRVVKDISSRFLSSNSRYVNSLTQVYNGQFSRAFNRAREEESDYFLIISFNEGSRTFLLNAELYLTKSGRKLKEFTYLKTGNNRILNCFDTLSADLNGFFPIIGSVKSIKGEEVLIDLGYYNGIKKDSVFNVVKKGNLSLIPDKPYIGYEPDKFLGNLKIKDAGEGISWGDFSSVSSFNLLNIGDSVILTEKEEKNSEINSETTIIDSELIEQLLQVN